ncbi:MAG: rhodanese-like domain-containing protein [Acidimicrobiales bacterium]|jgi:rhodanese-related sulfurtransferase|nr:rhodanese-like domain-containing protein [Acidimicrobiales bacterium]
MSAAAEPIPSVTVAEASGRDPSSVLLDVREDDEWAAGHAPDAVHVPMSRISLEDVPAGRPVYCICRSGNRSGRVTEALVHAGVEAFNVTGGMIAWNDAGLPVVH